MHAIFRYEDIPLQPGRCAHVKALHKREKTGPISGCSIIPVRNVQARSLKIIEFALVYILYLGVTFTLTVCLLYSLGTLVNQGAGANSRLIYHSVHTSRRCRVGTQISGASGVA